MFSHDEVYDACWGKHSPPILIPPRQRGGGKIQNSKICAKKRRVGNTYGHLGTRLILDVTSATTPLAIDGVKDGDGQANLACRTVKMKGKTEGWRRGRRRQNTPRHQCIRLVLPSTPAVNAGQRQRARARDASAVKPLASA